MVLCWRLLLHFKHVCVHVCVYVYIYVCTYVHMVYVHMTMVGEQGVCRVLLGDPAHT